MSLDILKRAQKERVTEMERVAEEQNVAIEQAKKMRKNDKKAFEDALNYGFSILEGAKIEYKVSDLTDAEVELIASVLGDEKAIEVIEKYDYLFEVKVVPKSGVVTEKVFTFKSKDLRTGAELVLNEVNTIIATDFNSLVLDKITLSGKRVLKVTEDMHFGDFVKKEAVGLDFDAEMIENLKPFTVKPFEKVNYEGQEREITYTYNLIADPLGNELMVFLIATTDGMVAKLKKGTFGLINHKNLTAIEFKLLKRVVNELLEAGIEVALEGKKAKDLGIWDEVDTSTITNGGKLAKEAKYSELKVVEEVEPLSQVEDAVEITEDEVDALFRSHDDDKVTF